MDCHDDVVAAAVGRIKSGGHATVPSGGNGLARLLFLVYRALQVLQEVARTTGQLGLNPSLRPLLQGRERRAQKLSDAVRDAAHTKRYSKCRAAAHGQ